MSHVEGKRVLEYLSIFVGVYSAVEGGRGKAVDCVWNVMAHAQKPDFVFRRNGRVHLNRRGCQFSLLLAAEVHASAVVMLDTPCSEVMWRVLATHSIRQFPLHFPSHASPCAITFQLDRTNYRNRGPTVLRMFLSFAAISYVMTWWFYCVDGTFGQRPSCVGRCLLCFLTFLHARPPLL